MNRSWDWFKAARAGDPSAKLYINDFNILEGGDTAHQDDFAATIQYLIKQGAPVEGIGLQSHFPARATPQALVRVPPDQADSLRWWVEQFFAFEVTTAETSRRVQRRDLELFLSFLEGETGDDSRRAWSPRVSRAFVDALKSRCGARGASGTIQIRPSIGSSLT